MPAVTTKSLSQIRLSWMAAAQASAAAVGKYLDFSVGSVSLAIAEGAATLGLWLQKIALQVLGMSRFATSEGADADSWGAQFQFFRLDATQATGSVTASRSTTTTRIVVPVGQQFKTTDSAQSFTVYSDTSNPKWSAPDNGYVLAIGVASAIVPAQADVAGIAGNVVAGTITVIVGGLSGIDAVTNAAAFLNGLDAETDPAYKARFPKYLAGLARANQDAIEAAIESVQQGIQYTLIENQNWVDSALVAAPGMFIAVIDDGSGSPPATLLQRVTDAIEAVRGFTIEFTVMAPVLVTVNTIFTLTEKPLYDKTTLDGLAQAVVTNWLNSRPLGTTIVPLTQIPQVVYDAVAGVKTITLVTVNGGTSDIAIIQVQRVRAGTVQVN